MDNAEDFGDIMFDEPLTPELIARMIKEAEEWAKHPELLQPPKPK